jgi:hypothetical protein
MSLNSNCTKQSRLEDGQGAAEFGGRDMVASVIRLSRARN